MPISIIGSGATASVKLVKNKHNGHVVVAKEISITGNESLKRIEHLQNERLIHELLSNHPFINQMINSFRTNDYLYMILPYCNNGDLKNLLNEKFLSITQDWIKFASASILLALQHIHSHGFLYFIFYFVEILKNFVRNCL